MITNDVNIGWEMFFWPKSDILYKTVQIDDEMELIYTGIVSREVVKEGDWGWKLHWISQVNE